MEALKIFAESWPLALMFIAVVVACMVLLIIWQFRRWDRESKETIASTARNVTPVRRHDD